MRGLIRQLVPAAISLVAFTILCGVAYPLFITAVAQVAFGSKADGNLIERDGRLLGSDLIGQPFVSTEYFHPRPSAAGDGYDGMASSGSNLGPRNADLLGAIEQRAIDYRSVNGLGTNAVVPVDAVTSSGSGLDPHISIANARLQATRVATTRGLAIDAVLAVVDEETDQPVFGVLGEPGVNVVAVNIALDVRFGRVG